VKVCHFQAPSIPICHVKPLLGIRVKLTPFLFQAKNALEHLNGFHLQERYIVGTFFLPFHFD
jgi:hypothetical protein